MLKVVRMLKVATAPPSIPLTSLSSQQQAFVESSMQRIEGASNTELLNLIRRMFTQTEVQTNHLAACIQLLTPEQIQSVFGGSMPLDQNGNIEAFPDC
jgi:hypothetical protein